MNVSDATLVDKDVLGGIPVFKDTRVPVENLFDYLAAGDSLNDFLDDFDYIPREYCVTILKAAEKLLTETHAEKAAFVKKTASDFRGTLKLTDEQYEDIQAHLK